MRTFQFDDQSLRQILEVAYRHGYEEAVSGTAPWRDYDLKQKERTLENATSCMKYGDILILKEPDIW